MQFVGQAEPFQVHYAYLLALLKRECVATGSIGLAAGRAVRVSEVSPPSFGSYPAIGIQCTGRTVGPDSNRTRMHESRFEISVSLDASFNENEPDIERALKNAVEKILNDQSGHGLFPTLYQDTTLGGTAITSYDTELFIAIGEQEDDASSSSGHASITFITRAQQRLV